MLQRKRIRGATSIRHRRARGGDDDDDVDERRPDDAKAKSFYRLPSTSTGATTTTTMPASSTCEGGEQKITPDSKCPPRLPSRFRWGGREQSVHTPISTSTSREVGTRKRSRPNLITARRSVAGPQLDSRVLRAQHETCLENFPEESRCSLEVVGVLRFLVRPGLCQNSPISA